MSESLDRQARDVVRRFLPGQEIERLTALQNAGGFSGARLWQVQTAFQTWCLRAWPPDQPNHERLRFIHQLQERAAVLPFVPRLAQLDNGSTFVESAGRMWELSTWQPGVADYRVNPTPARLRAACGALAQLHSVWTGEVAQEKAPLSPDPSPRSTGARGDSLTPSPPVLRGRGLGRGGLVFALGARLLSPDPSPQSTGARGEKTCPAVLRRLDAYDHCQRHRARCIVSPNHPLARTCSLLNQHIDAVPTLLQPWLKIVVSVRPCLCDCWHDHFLLDGDTLTGLIDYGAVKIDHVAVDLARRLGSLAGNDESAWTIGLAAYRELAPLSEQDEALVRVLDRTGSILALWTWVRRLLIERRHYPDSAAVERRLLELTRRFESSRCKPGLDV